MVVEDSKGECNFGQHEINFLFSDALRAADNHVDLQERRQGDGRPGRQGDHLHGQVRRARGQLVPHPPLAARQRRVDRLRRGGGAVRSLPGRHARGPARADALPRAEHQLLQALRRAAPSPRPRWRGATTTARAPCAWSATAPAAGSSAASPGADVNPYLALSALIAAGLHGVDSGLDARAGARGQRLRGRPSARRCPRRCATRATCSRSSAIARDAFGQEVVEHYLNNARVELEAYDAAVTDWERFRGFERL